MVGYIVHLRLPGPLREWSIRTFGNYYKIDFAEAEKPIAEYPSIGEFFIRRLKAGARPVAESRIVHPADSRISQIGAIEMGRLIQAKGKTYSLESFLYDETALQKYENGLFATYYLCPTDYHRVHSPVTGRITAVTHIPGALWPVNEWSVGNIENLFCVNERVIVEFQTEWGPVALVLVGATNVGKISLSFESEILSNQPKRIKPQKIIYQPGPAINKGDELGIFHMGSTVVMCYPQKVLNAKTMDQWLEFQGNKAKMGEAFL